MCNHKRRDASGRFLFNGCILGPLVLIVWLWCIPVEAVDKGKISYTAEAVCAFRSIAASDPDPKTRNPDDMAKAFINPDLNQRFPGLGLPYEDAKIAMDRMNNGVFYYVNARTHHMDAMLASALEAGARQVVIMGAGFDSRAYRFHQRFPKVRFFEIDLPATSEEKQQRVEKILGRQPEWVTFVPIDFNTQTLDVVLERASFATDQKTFFVWEGVTYFISESGVDNTLRYIAEHSAPGSQVVFDYMLEDVVQGKDYSAYGARRTVYHVGHRGEPYIFGISPPQLETFINHRGLALQSDLGPKDLSRRYLTGSNGTASGKNSEFLHIVHAQVPKRSEIKRLRQHAELNIKRADANKVPALNTHQVKVPDDVQVFLKGHSQCIVNKDLDALSEYISKNYRANGRNGKEVIAYIGSLYQGRPVDQYKIILTRFDQTGDKAKIDGFIQRNGFRLPLMGFDIIKEADGRWRWYGNQQ